MRDPEKHNRRFDSEQEHWFHEDWSNRIRSPMAILPESGVTRPATQSSSVVFPAPEGPKMIVMPGATVNATSRVKWLALLEKRLRRATVKLSRDAESVGRLMLSVLIGAGLSENEKVRHRLPTAHARARYRCFLPDLAGLAGVRRAGPMPDLFDFSITIVLFPFSMKSPTMYEVHGTSCMTSVESDIAPLPTAVQRYFEVALYLLVMCGFGTLVSTGGLDLPTILLVVAALLFRGYLLATRRTWLIPESWTTTLTLGYVAFYLADYFVLSGLFVSATVHLVLFVMVVRLFSTRRDRDYYFLAIISFLMVLAAAVLTVDSTFLLAFAAFMLMAVVTCILMEMRSAAANAMVRAKASNDDLAQRKMGISLASASPVLALLILLIAAAIFFVLPRLSNGYFSAFARGRVMSTGFSDQVQLGQIGEIQQSNSLVMHIQIDGDRAWILRSEVARRNPEQCSLTTRGRIRTPSMRW